MKVEMQLGNEKLSIETGKVAKQADGTAWVEYGGTVVLVAVVASRKSSNMDFFPLTVDYRERGYASGKIPSVYGRREPRPGASDQLTARLIDHCIRPLFPKDFNYELQVLCTVLSYDGENLANVASLIGASAALSISDIPFNGPVGAINVGRINGELITNPTVDQAEECDLQFFVSGNENAVMSVEGHAHEVPEDEVIDAIVYAHEQIKEVIKLQEGMIAVCAKPKREYDKKEIDQSFDDQVRNLATDQIRKSIGMDAKQDRAEYLEEVQESIVAQIISESGLEDEDDIQIATKDAISILGSIEKEEMRRSILEEGKRVDSRTVTEVRPILNEVSVLPRTHGSSIFSRGQTQALCAVTLGTSMDESVERTMAGEKSKPFFLHYNFPAYSVGEVRRIMGPGRREIGHGMLAENAILPIIPDQEKFSYTIRVVSEILESNASSSMATVCGTTLALMDAGVPIKKPVAGVGVGLIKDGDREVILTDMIGTEDFLGDMDFKVAGTADGITAIQMDIKIDGVTPDLMRRAIHQAKEARLFVLDKMAEAIAEPREELSPYAPRIYVIQIPVEKIRDLIGPRGKVVQGIQEETGAQISIEDDGKVEIATTSAESAELAEQRVREVTAVPEEGKEYSGTVARIADFGAFVTILPNYDGLIHISKMGSGYIARVEDVLSVGDPIDVRVISINNLGQIDLVPVTPIEAPEGQQEPPDRPPRSSGRGRSGGSGGGGRKPRGNRGGGGSSRRSPRLPKGRF